MHAIEKPIIWLESANLQLSNSSTFISIGADLREYQNGKEVPTVGGKREQHCLGLKALDLEPS